MDAVRPWLYIGKLAETLTPDLLHHAGIGAMLQLCQEVQQPGITSLYLAVEDGEPLAATVLAKGVQFIRERKAQGQTVLVACGSGISRSATFALAALKEEEERGLLDAFREVTAGRREARPHPVLWKSLCEYYAEPVPLLDMLRACPPQRTPW